MPQGECIVDKAWKKSAYTIFGPQIARTEVPFSVICQLLIYPLARHPLLRIVLWDPSS